MKRWHCAQSGFTLLELMIVVAVITIILALAIPSFTEARKSANETRAISYLKAIHSAQSLYENRFGFYADSDEELVAAGYLQGVTGAGGNNTQSGYTFIVDRLGRYWEATAQPLTPGETGNRYFYIDASAVLRWNEGGAADDQSPPLDS